MATYEDYLRDNISWLERLGDKLSGSDERLDYAIQRLAEIQQSIGLIEVPDYLALLQAVSAKLDALMEYLKEVGITMPTSTQQIVFSQALTPLQGVRMEEMIPLDGMITSVSFTFPLGTNDLVDIAVGHSGKQFMPINGFIALTGASPVYPTNEKVAREETVWCVMNNTDGGWPHTVTATVVIEGD